MEQKTEHAWLQLSAYIDGELGLMQRLNLKRRLLVEPELCAMHREIQGVSQALKNLDPQMGLATKPPRHYSLCKLTAMAASIAALAAFTTHVVLTPAAVQSPLGWHHAFLDQSYKSNETAELIPVSFADMDDAPDLLAAGLTLVDNKKTKNNNRMLHYSGRNGCRLTLAVTRGALPALTAEPDLRMASWNFDADHYTLMSSGMDALRFAAISRHVRMFTEKQHRKNTVMAMRIATKNAVPCV